MVTTVRKPAARRPAPAAKSRVAAPPAKPAPVAKKAAARPVSDAKREQLAAARAAQSKKAVAARNAPTNVHPLKKERITGHDVARAWQTALDIQAAYIAQERDEITEAVEYVAPVGSSKTGPREKSPAARAKVDPEERVIGEFYDREKIEKYSVKDLRELAADLAERRLITETKLKSKILEQMEGAGLFRADGSADADEDGVEDDFDEEAEDDGGEDDAEESAEDVDDDDEDETEDRVYDLADLKAMTLKDLQELAEANEYDWKGLGKAELIDAMLADEEEEDEDSEEEEEEDGDEEEAVEIDPEELPNMGLSELLELCAQIELKVPANKRKNKKAVIELILDELGEDDE